MTTESAARRGKALRERVPRSAHGRWQAAADRPDPVEVLRRQAETRVPELVPIRYGRMLASPFTFFRGGAAIMAGDLAATPISGLHVQLCGDAHLENFGGFAAPDRHLVFDVNDFDETLPGPWEWDLKRLTASTAVAGREQGLDAGQRRAAVLSAAAGYRGAMRGFSPMRTVDVWYARFELDEQFARWSELADEPRRQQLDKALAKARRKDSRRAFAKLTHEVDGRPRILSDPPLIVPIEDMVSDAEQLQPIQDELFKLFKQYRRSLADDKRHLLDGYEPVDLAYKVVGIGSVGLQAWIVLLIGNGLDDPLFLQIKEAEPSVLEPFTKRSQFAAHGRRVVEGQRLIQAGSDVFLGWFRATDERDGRTHDYYVRQLWDSKGSVDATTLPAPDLANYAGICGWTMARGHARSGDGVAIAAYLGKGDRFDRALADFAEAYADQNERDYEAFSSAVRAGKVAAETGV
jgi:uncharacterized protein (DUF2252 family)